MTIDFDSLEDKSVTVRERDTMSQVRLKVEELIPYLEARLAPAPESLSASVF
ncbi:Glycine--tRNA ligase [compost metagenome]